MRLGRKNLLYSMALAGVMMLFLIGYFIYMLPSLYVDYVMEQNLRSICEQHRAYMETGSYDGVKVKNATACFSMEFPLDGDYVLVTGRAYSAKLQAKDERIRLLLDSCREKLKAYREQEDAGESSAGFPEKRQNTPESDAGLPSESREQPKEELDLSEEMDAFIEILQESISGDSGAGFLPVEVTILADRGNKEDFFNESVKAHFYSDDLSVLEFGVQDAHNQYANYIALEWTKNRLVLSFLPVVAPDADEIRPVVLLSLPMLGAVILLLVLLFSQVYSRGIVGPILRLARHAEEMEQAQDFAVSRLSEEWADRKDEVRQLADTLDDFYLRIRESYQELEEKNRELAEENRRQEVFLRASSHQLKTPIAAALLLVEGMMNEVGRYKETKVYLPKVKEQLLSMRSMVEEILYLNHCSEEIKLQQVDVGGLLRGHLGAYQVELADKKVRADIFGEESLKVRTDERMIARILDNLLSNAVRYTPEGGQIGILLGRGEEGKPEIRIENSGAAISEELLPHIFEPFVSGSHESRISSHGLGLYIASYYAKKLDVRLTVKNGEAGVVSAVTFWEDSVNLHKSSM